VNVKELPKPDLIVSSVGGVSSSYTIGDKLDGYAWIKNNGNDSAGSSKLQYYLGTDANPTKYSIEQGGVGSLGPGESEKDEINGPGWTILTTVTPGTYRLWVEADSTSIVAESNENNNWASSASFTVAAAPVLLPDLRIISALMNGLSTFPTVKAGDSVRLDFDVINEGQASTKPGVDLRWWWGTTKNSKANYIADGILGSFNGLQPGEVERETDASWQIPNLSPGTYWLTAHVDWNDENKESDETDNLISKPFTVGESAAPIIHLTDPYDTLNVYPGQTITIRWNDDDPGGKATISFLRPR
jgi:hypothetical protein